MASSDGEETDSSWSVRQISVLSSNRHMFDRQLACDVHFVVQGYGDAHAVTVGAHRYVLFSRSPVFYRMFCTSADEPWEDKDDDDGQTLEPEADDEAKAAFRQEEIRIDDMPSEAFKELLRFLYYEEASLTDENVMLVMYAARKYRVTPLIDVCKRHVDKAMNADRVLGMLRQSLTFADEELRARCLSFVGSSTSDVISGQQFVDVSEDILTMIVDQPQLSVLEVDLFKACVDWARRQLRRDDLDANADGPALRRTLQNVLPRIRFPTMSLDQFSTVVVPLGILASDETCELYKYLTCHAKPETKFSAVPRCVKRSTSAFHRVLLYTICGVSAGVVIFAVMKHKMCITVRTDHLA